MKVMNRSILLAVLVALSAGAYCQESNVLAKCLGKPLSAYGKAFGQPGTETKKTPQGVQTIGDYKTGSARIIVTQLAGAKIPTIIVAEFYQEPKYDWKLALTTVGLSSAGVVAKEDSKHQVLLSHIKTGKAGMATAVFVPMSKANPDGPELHLTLKKK